MKHISNYTWKITNEQNEKIIKIKDWLLNKGGKELETKNIYEKWRIKYYDATITYYESEKKRTIHITDSYHDEVYEFHKFVYTLLGSQFIISDKKFLIGLDEVGKGEIIGHVYLVGVLIPIDIYSDLEIALGVANTKISHEFSYWENVFRKIDFFKDKGLFFVYETIPPWDYDKYNINNLMDITYQKILNNIAQKVSLTETRIVIDNYGIGEMLKKFLNALKNAGAEIVVENNGDEKYLESRTASIIAKYYQVKSLEGIKCSPEYKIDNIDIGSGNAGDEKTLNWLKSYWEKNKSWPWFVKKSFKTIAKIEGREEIKKKLNIPLTENFISSEFKNKFFSGKLNIDSLTIQCPYCGNICHSIKIALINNKTTAKCIMCDKNLDGINYELRYYCGKILPDSDIIISGFLSKDLEGVKFFENFTVLMNSVVAKETDKPGGKKEWARLGKFASIGRIKLEKDQHILENIAQDSFEKDDLILKSALQNNAIIITADNSMKARAMANKLFLIEKV